MVIWYNLLHAVNIVSKTLQNESMDIGVAITQLKGLISFLEKYRETRFQECMVEAKDIASEMGIEPIFHEKRIIRRKKHFDESASEEVTQQSALELFRVNYFILNIVDQALSSIKNRFEHFQKYEETFRFLFDLKKLKSANIDSLKLYCANLEMVMKDGELSDINGKCLFSVLRILREMIPKDAKMAIQVLNFLKMDGCFPNAWIAYRILLTITVTVASAERSFSKLKLIKFYLRSTMSQERLNGLAMLSIEKNIAEKLDYVSLINTFASKNARRAMFR